MDCMFLLKKKGAGSEIVAIIQARMGSTRLPGKVLMDLGGATVLSRVVQRVSRAKSLHEIVVATSHAERDVRSFTSAFGSELHAFSDPKLMFWTATTILPAM